MLLLLSSFALTPAAIADETPLDCSSDASDPASLAALSPGAPAEVALMSQTATVAAAEDDDTTSINPISPRKPYQVYIPNPAIPPHDAAQSAQVEPTDLPPVPAPLDSAASGAYSPLMSLVSAAATVDPHPNASTVPQASASELAMAEASRRGDDAAPELGANFVAEDVAMPSAQEIAEYNAATVPAPAAPMQPILAMGTEAEGPSAPIPAVMGKEEEGPVASAKPETKITTIQSPPATLLIAKTDTTSIVLGAADSSPQPASAPTPALALPPLPLVDGSPAGEPVPSLDDATRKTLQQLPTGIGSPPPGEKEHITVDHGGDTESSVSAIPADAPASPDGKPVRRTNEPPKPKADIAISRKPKHYNIRDDLEKAYDDLMSGDTQGAVEHYNEALTRDPKNETALFGLAATYQRTGQNELARPLYSKLLHINPMHRGALNNFLALVAAEAPQEALGELQTLAMNNPDFSPIPAQMAVIYQKMGQSDQAIEYMSRAMALSPENLAYRYDLAVLLDRAGRRADAAAFYQQLVDASLRGQAIPGDLGHIQHRLTYLRSAKN